MQHFGANPLLKIMLLPGTAWIGTCVSVIAIPSMRVPGAEVPETLIALGMLTALGFFVYLPFGFWFDRALDRFSLRGVVVIGFALGLLPILAWAAEEFGWNSPIVAFRTLAAVVPDVILWFAVLCYPAAAATAVVIVLGLADLARRRVRPAT